MTTKTEPTLTSLDTDIDRTSGRIRAHRAMLTALASFIARHHPSTPHELRALLEHPSSEPNTKDLPQATKDAMDEEMEILLRRIDTDQ